MRRTRTDQGNCTKNLALKKQTRPGLLSSARISLSLPDKAAPSRRSLCEVTSRCSSHDEYSEHNVNNQDLTPNRTKRSRRLPLISGDQSLYMEWSRSGLQFLTYCAPMLTQAEGVAQLRRRYPDGRTHNSPQKVPPQDHPNHAQ
eukprot:2912563-Amphidinium_carterae.1